MSNRPKAVDFLNYDDPEKEETKNLSLNDEEPVLVSETEEQEEGDEYESESEHEESKTNVETLPSGAISKGKILLIDAITYPFPF